MLAATALFVALVVARRWPARLVAGGVCVCLLLLTGAGFVNAHFRYYREVRDVFGYRGADAASLADLDTTVVPTNGKLVQIDIPGTVSGFDGRPAQVYVPPAWFETPRPQLPVVLMLQGSPGDTTDWSVGGEATMTADAFAAKNGGKAPVLVMADPNGSIDADTECVDSPSTRPETYLTTDVPAAIVKQFGTLEPGKGWAIAGLSMGGMCSIMLALRHPDVFSAFGDYGGLIGPRSGEGNAVGSTVKDLFAGSQSAFDAHEPQTILKATNFSGLGGWFEVGTDDAGPLEAAKTLAPLAQKAGIDTCFVPVPGGEHTFDVWSEAFEDSLPWLSARLGLVTATPAMTSACTSP